MCVTLTATNFVESTFPDKFFHPSPDIPGEKPDVGSCRSADHPKRAVAPLTDQAKSCHWAGGRTKGGLPWLGNGSCLSGHDANADNGRPFCLASNHLNPSAIGIVFTAWAWGAQIGHK